MNEIDFEQHFKKVCQIVIEKLDTEDPDLVEAVMDNGVIKIMFANKKTFVLNAQRPVREIWFASDKLAWHFTLQNQTWRCNKTHRSLGDILQESISGQLHKEFLFTHLS
jgi:iron donor protein CyaY